MSRTTRRSGMTLRSFAFPLALLLGACGSPAAEDADTAPGDSASLVDADDGVDAEPADASDATAPGDAADGAPADVADTGGESDGGGSTPLGSATVRGVVVDLGGAPVEGATVGLGAARATTGADGGFSLGGLPPAGRLPVWAEGPGTTRAHAVLALGAATPVVRLVLAPTTTATLADAAAGGAVAGDGGLTLEFVGQFTDEAGAAVTGPVTVRTALVGAGAGLAAVPPLRGAHGGPLAARAVVAVELTQGDAPVRFAGTAVALLPAGAGLPVGEATSWTYDEAAGGWHAAGAVEERGGRVALVLPHLSWWMVGGPAEATGCVTLSLSAGGAAADGAAVYARGLDYLGSNAAAAGEDGAVCVEVASDGTTALDAWLLAAGGEAPAMWQGLVTLRGEAGSCDTGGCRDLGPQVLTAVDADDDGDGVSEAGGDCDDGDDAVHPGAAEGCDRKDTDCDGALPAGEADADGDGVATCEGDCDDADAARAPGRAEACDGVDNDCDGALPADEQDVDADGVAACAGDCDDGDAARTPGRAEVCDGRDNDCDGALPADEADADSDGVAACAGDCDDDDAARYAGAAEVCDGLDDDCDGRVPAEEADRDGDGQPPCAGDCDDDDAARHPGAAEGCDGADSDCDGVVPGDEADADGDGQPLCAGDCDDGDAARVAGGEERCDGLDNDCDGVVEAWVTAGGAVTLQGAIDAAADGDTICADRGSYAGELRLEDRAVRVVAVWGPGETELVGGGVGPVVTFAGAVGAGALLDGFTIRGGDAADGGGVLVEGGTPTLRGLVVRDNAASKGGGVAVTGGAPVLEDVELSDNTAALEGGGLYWAGGDGQASGLRLLRNTATSGGGLGAASGTLAVDDLVAEGNAAAALGGGLNLGSGAALALRNALVLSNTSGMMGGGAAVRGALTGANVLFVANDGHVSGGGLFVRGGEVELTHAVVVANTTAGDGAGVAVDFAGSAAFSHAIFADNAAGVAGGGVLTDDAESTVALAWCGAWGNAPDDVVLAGAAADAGDDYGAREDDPRFVDVAGAAPAAWDLHLDPASPYVDAGDPAVLDPDGSPSDIGAYGGPGAGGFDLDADGAVAWWHPGAFAAATDGPAGLDPDDRDADVPRAGDDRDGDGVATGEGDCDDADAHVYPGAVERCDGKDSDCDGVRPADEADADGDGVSGCAGDCADGDPARHPGAAEGCDGEDSDCDGAVPAAEVDADGDGAPACADCNDSDPERYPGAAERCNRVDDDCDAATVERWIVALTGAGRVQAQIAAAADGDAVCVPPGTWAETIDLLGKAIRVEGPAGAARTTLDGGGAGPVVTMGTGDAARADALVGVTVTGGSAADGGGVWVAAGSSTHLGDLVVEGNHAAADGGGVAVDYGASVTLERVTFADNAAGSGGGGLHAGSGVALVGRELVFDGNRGGFNGGGLAVDPSSTVTLDGLVLRDNSTVGVGGGMALQQVEARLTRVQASGNQAGRGAAIAQEWGTLEATQLVVEDNAADWAGGGLWASGADVHVRYARFQGNTSGAYGGGLHLEGGSLAAEHVLLLANAADVYGGGLRGDVADALALTNVTIVGNTARAGAGVHAGGTSGSGSTLALTNAAFVDNAAVDEGGAVAVDAAVATAIRNCDFWGNTPTAYVVGGAAAALPALRGNIATDPDFLGYDAAAAAAGWDLHLAEGSPLVNAGWLLLRDPDGSRSDIGAYGGAGAGGFDLDGDGAFDWWHAGAYDAEADDAAGLDPDDADAGVFPASGLDADGDGQSPRDGDCDDGDARTWLGAAERCDGRDNDCDGAVPAGEADADADGYRACGGECDDGDAAVYPGAAEVCDGVDTDCDGADLGDEVDGDGDGQPLCAGDCDDADPLRFAGAEEACDGVDNDCGGVAEISVAPGAGALQAAIDAAADGDTLCVAPGTYAEVLTVDRKGLRLIGTGGAAQTVLDAGGAGTAITFTATPAGTLLEGFTVTGGEGLSGGGGVHADASRLTVRDVVVRGNHAAFWGGGVTCVSCDDLVLEDARVTGNTSDYAGGGVVLWASAATLRRVVVAANEAPFGGGVKCTDSLVTADQLRVHGNAADDDGGGVIAVRGALALSRSAVVDNSAGSMGGGMWVVTPESLRLANVALLGNTSGPDGGGGLALVGLDGPGQLTNVLIAGNRTGGDGGGLLVDGAGHPVSRVVSLTLTQVTLAYDRADGSGGALAFFDGPTTTLTNVALASESAGGDGGGVYVDAATPPTYAYSAFWDNAPGHVHVVGAAPALLIGVGGNIAADPQFVDVFGHDPAAWDLRLGSGSTLVGAGDPALTDPDVSRSDIGAYGGADADAFDWDADGWPQRWAPGAFAWPADALAGLDDADLDPARGPHADTDGDGAAPADGDCDDGDRRVLAGAPERCNGRDDDCDTLVPADEADADGDGLAPCAGDCDDTDAAVGPGAPETCDGRDNDCDGETDEERCYTCTRFVPDDHATVQAAIAAAATGDVVCVRAGTYREALDFLGKAVHVVGYDGADDTVIDARAAASVVRFASGEGPGAILEDVTLRGGRAPNGGGVYVEAAAPTLRGVRIEACEAVAAGGGIYLTNAPATLDGVGVIGCTAGTDGGGVAARHSAFTARHLLVSGNAAAARGGGLFLTSVSTTATTARVDNAIVTANTAGLDGGGAFVDGDPRFPLRLVVTQGALVANAATRAGGALFVATDGEAELKNCDVSDNTAGAGTGGGVRDMTAAGIDLLFDNLIDNAPGDYEGPLPSPVGTAGTVSLAPGYLDRASTPAWTWDLHLAAGSALIDRGDWTLVDPDGSRSDIGPYGGARAGAWDRDGDGALGRWAPGPYDPAADADLDPDDGDPALSPGGDLDGDGFAPSAGDCDDTDPAIHPGAPERCNGVDDDCDGRADDEDDDDDGDDLSPCAGDCDDTDDAVAPGADEVCDGKDSDCDGSAGPDEADGDGDGVPVCANDCDDANPDVHPGAAEGCDGLDTDCDGAPGDDEWDSDWDGFSACAGDCDDGSDLVHPGADEVCDGRDTDCDGDADDETADEDQDGQSLCAGDCDDADPNRRQGLAERCDGVDNNCNYQLLTTERDLDHDGWYLCNGDCVDTNPLRHPGAPEGCDGIDTDCDGQLAADEADADGDGVRVCDGDCDDTRPSVSPAAPEICDGLDSNCTGGPAADEVDADGDGQRVCGGDCDDGDPERWLGAPEACGGGDSSCGAALERHVPTAFATIGAALAAAEDGDVVCVAEGHYVERLDFAGKAVRVEGTGDPARTIVDGNLAGSVALFVAGEGPEAGLSGLTLTGGRAARGGGVRVVGASPTLSRVRLLGNEATEAGGGAWLEGSGARLERVEAAGNTAPTGGGLAFGGSGAPSVEWAFVHDNFASGFGGGVYCGGTVAGSFTNGRVEGNLGSDGGGFGIDGGCAMRLERVRLLANQASGSGGGVYVMYAMPPASHLLFVANRANGGGGGALLVNRTSPSWSHVVMLGNRSSGSGAAVYVVAGTPAFANSVFANNVATATDGGALHAGAMVLRACDVHGNEPRGFVAMPDPTGALGNVAVAPGFLDVSAQSPAAWILRLAATSVLVDGGVFGQLDPDLSPADIGAFGGAATDDWDLDGDGAPARWQPGPYDPQTDPAAGWDCDDLDATRTPEAGCAF